VVGRVEEVAVDRAVRDAGSVELGVQLVGDEDLSACRTSVRFMDGGAGSGRDAVWALLDEADAVAGRLAALSFDGLTPAEVLAVLARRAEWARRGPAIDHRLLSLLTAEAVPAELGATTLAKGLAHRLRISHGEARRRLDEAADLGPGRALTGEPPHLDDGSPRINQYHHPEHLLLPEEDDSG
jgi:hypothetical protein